MKSKNFSAYRSLATLFLTLQSFTLYMCDLVLITEDQWDWEICGALFSCTDVSFLDLYSITYSHISSPKFKSVSPELNKTTMLCLGSPSLHSCPELIHKR